MPLAVLICSVTMQRAARWRRRVLGLVGAGAGGAVASECSGPEWTLALGAGQNDFSVVVSSASAVAQVLIMRPNTQPSPAPDGSALLLCSITAALTDGFQPSTRRCCTEVTVCRVRLGQTRNTSGSRNSFTSRYAPHKA